MSATSPTRVDSTMYAAAQAAGERSHRSAAQQIAHWARLGQELEASGLSQRDIDRVLAGQLSYDEVGIREQTAVRTAWREALDDDITALDLRSDFETEGRTRVSTADEAGHVTVHTGDDGGPAQVTGSRRRRARLRDVSAE